jgi:hypothetical protein
MTHSIIQAATHIVKSCFSTCRTRPTGGTSLLAWLDVRFRKQEHSLLINPGISQAVYKWATGWRAGVRSRQCQEICLSSIVSRPALAATQPLIQWVLKASFLGAKRPDEWNWPLPPCIAEVKNGEAIRPLPHMPSWRGSYIIKLRVNFGFTLQYWNIRNFNIYVFEKEKENSRGAKPAKPKVLYSSFYGAADISDCLASKGRMTDKYYNRFDQCVAGQQFCKHGPTRNNKGGCVFYAVRSDQRWKTGLYNPFLSNGSVNTFPRIGPCYENGDVISNRDGVFRGVCAECL